MISDKYLHHVKVQYSEMVAIKNQSAAVPVVFFSFIAHTCNCNSLRNDNKGSKYNLFKCSVLTLTNYNHNETINLTKSNIKYYDFYCEVINIHNWNRFIFRTFINNILFSI